MAAVMRKERPLISALWVQWVPPRHTQGPRAQMALAAGRWLGAMRRCVMGKGRKQEAKADGGAFGLHRRSRGAQGSCADTLPTCAACLTVLILAACVCVSRVGSSIGSCVHDAPPPLRPPSRPHATTARTLILLDRSLGAHRLLGQCSQPRPGVLERRERAERMFEEQRAAEAAVKMQAEARAVETAAAAASAAMTAPGAGGTDGVAESTMAGMPGATAAASSSGATAVSPAASGPLHSTSPGSKMRDMPGIAGMHGIQDMHGMQGKQGIAPVHVRAPAGRSAHDPEVAAASEATPWVPSAQPEAAGAQEQWVQATAEGTQMVRGPGGQWRPKPAVGGGSGRPRTTPASVPSAGWCVGWRKPRKDGAAATATLDHGLIHERPHASAPDEALGLSNGSAWQHAGDAMAPPAGAPVAYGGAPQPAGAGGPRSLWAAPDGGADTAPVARGQKGAATRDVWNEFSVEAGEDDDEDDVNLVVLDLSQRPLLRPSRVQPPSPVRPPHLYLLSCFPPLSMLLTPWSTAGDSQHVGGQRSRAVGADNCGNRAACSGSPGPSSLGHPPRRHGLSSQATHSCAHACTQMTLGKGVGNTALLCGLGEAQN